MVQVAWGAIALLAAAVFGMFGMFFYLGQKIDSTNKRIDEQGASLSARIDALSARLDTHIEHHAS